ncbi:MAG: hypothetical protein ACRD18_05085 [Terriglobia bacterium]
MEQREYQFHETVIAKLATLESMMRTLTGNGAPGRVDRLEQSVHKLEELNSRQTGIIVGVGGVVSFISGFLFYLFDVFRH